MSSCFNLSPSSGIVSVRRASAFRVCASSPGILFAVISGWNGSFQIGADTQLLAGTESHALAPFGSQVPYGDPTWYQSWHSPYYKDSHVRLRAAIREWIDRDIIPNCHEWDQNREVPAALFANHAKSGVLACMMGAPFVSKYAGDVKIPGGVKPEEYDHFHFITIIDEISRCASGGVLWALGGGATIGLPPILHFGSEEMRAKICPPVLRGEKAICLAITEPYAGSDLKGIRTTAVKSQCGTHYIVNGEKKWITNGIFADYFTTAVKTSENGISLLLISRDFPGVSTRRIDCSGCLSSGTTYIVFDNVKVPTSNLIGEENQGFKYIAYNFNNERLMLAVQAIRFARVAYEEAFKYSFLRKTFGKRLIDHAVIRNKFGQMIRKIESTQCWLELITYQLTQMSPIEARVRLGGPIALLKTQATSILEFCVREASQIFGGLSYTKGGVVSLSAEKVERLSRDVRAYCVGGGSEEIMLDLGVRQAQRLAKF